MAACSPRPGPSGCGTLQCQPCGGGGFDKCLWCLRFGNQSPDQVHDKVPSMKWD